MPFDQAIACVPQEEHSKSHAKTALRLLRLLHPGDNASGWITHFVEGLLAARSRTAKEKFPIS